jgi:hypothetical protein
MRAATRQLGVDVSNAGVIFAPFAQPTGLAAEIVLVANASKYAAHRLIESMKPRPRRNFKDALERLLETEFGHEPVRKASSISGAHKPHKFDYVISVGNQRQLLLDGVTPEAAGSMRPWSPIWT